MIAEVRDVGEKRLAVYTDSPELAARLKRWQTYITEVTYLNAGRVVGVDLYLDNAAGPALKRLVNRKLPALTEPVAEIKGR